MFDPFFNENDQLEIVLGCSLKKFTKFIGHPVTIKILTKILQKLYQLWFFSNKKENGGS